VLEGAVNVSAMLPANRPVGALRTVAVIDSPQVRPFVENEDPVAESTVTSIRTSAAVVPVSPPTTVSEVCPLGPTKAPIAVDAKAEAGATDDRMPKPNAEIVTSAMRLKINFVDIYFLSIVAGETIPPTAGEEKIFAS